MTVEIPLSRGLVALVDDADADLLSQSTWYALPGTYTWYAARGVRRADGRWTTQMMHKVLTGWPKTDHINGDGLDNRRANLRPATASQNVSNKRKTGGSSRYKGVSWDARNRRWAVRIDVARRQHYLGKFLDERLAAEAYDAAARKHFGEFAALNFPRPGERSALVDVPALRIRPTTTTMWRKAQRLQPVEEGGSDDHPDPSR